MRKSCFVKCGIVGLIIEIIWTGLEGVFKKDFRMRGFTSIWMFPIYGLACAIEPISKKLKMHHICTFIRGVIYAVGIFIVEFISGSFLKKKKCCPWDYSNCKLNIKGVIRIDYAPLWFLTGLFMERIVTLKKSTKKKI